MYAMLLKILFRFDAEKVHYFSMNMLKKLCALAPTKYLIKKLFYSPSEKVNVFGLTFRNSVGLAAGFDKNAAYLNALDCLGFGFVEIGTVTPLPQAGNEKPRLFRLPADKAIINRMGFNNDGMIAIAENLKSLASLRVPVIAIITGEGGSGGALAIGVANKVMMMENSIYSVISPEGCAAILWRTRDKAAEAAEALKVTSSELKKLNVIDEIIAEPLGGAHKDWITTATNMEEAIIRSLRELSNKSEQEKYINELAEVVKLN
jgi:hypothetical protein